MFYIEHFFDEITGSFTYVLSDRDTFEAAVIDPVIFYDENRSQIKLGGLQRVVDYIKDKNLVLRWILETHIHADHLSGSFQLRKMLGGKVAISDQIFHVIDAWAPIFGWKVDNHFLDAGFDHLLKEGEDIPLGKQKIKVLLTPGHTPASLSYLFNDSVFVGDALMMPDLGTARTDFIGGSASELYRSVKMVLSLPEDYRVFVGHDYPSGRDLGCFATVGDHLRTNSMIRKETTEEEFVAMRSNKDTGKNYPRLIFQSVQFNLKTGFSKVVLNGDRFSLTIPVDNMMTYPK